MSRKKRRRDSDLFRPVDSFGQLLCDILRRRVGIEYFSWIDRKIEGLMYIWAMESFNLRPLGRFSIPYDTDRFHGISNTCFQLTLYFCAPGKFCRFLYGTHETACGKCSSTNRITLRSTYLPQPIQLSWTNTTISSWGGGGGQSYKKDEGTRHNIISVTKAV